MNQAYPIGSTLRPVAAQDVETRATFITRTYSHLFIALAALTMLEVWYFHAGIAEGLARSMSGNWMLVLLAFMAVSWLATHMALRAQSYMAQYTGLLLYTVISSIILLPMLYIAKEHAPAGTIGNAVIITLGGFAGLTAIVFTTRKDFSFLGSVLRWGMLCALALIALAFFTDMHLGTWFSVAMIAFAGAAILYDTSNVLRHYPEDRYVGAALALFASVVMLFFYVLRLLLSLGSRD